MGIYMDHQDKVAYFPEIPELWNDEKIPLPGMVEGFKKIIGKKLVREKSKFASETNMDAHLRTIFGTTLNNVYNIYDDEAYAAY